MTMLTLLTVPLAAAMYFVCCIIGFETLSYPNEYLAFFMGDIAALLTIMTSWLLLWSRDVDWDRCTSKTIIFSIGAIALGFVTAWLVSVFYSTFHNVIMGVFLGGIVTCLAWMIGACIFWRQPAAATSAAPGQPGHHDVVCLKCGYVLNGLTEARCPECGERYTLDGLLHAQQSQSDIGAN